MRKVLSFSGFSEIVALCAAFFTLLSGVSLAAETVKAYTTFEEPMAKQIFDAFEKDTGIKVEWVRLSGGEVVARLEAEKQNPQAGIWVGGVGTQHIEAKNKGLTTPYNSPEASRVPQKFRDKDRYWTGLYLGNLSFAGNTKRMKELGLPMPTSWADLTKPIYAKKIRMAHPSTSGTSYNVMTTVIRLNDGDENKAFAYLKKLNKAIDQYTKSGSAPGKSAAIGEVPIAIGYEHDQLRLKAQGAPIEIVVPSEGVGYETASMSIIKNGPNPVASKKLYNWILSDKANKIISEWYLTPLAGSGKNGGSMGKIKLVNQNDEWDAANKSRLIERWNKEITSKYKE